ncbi:hypothetical protein ABEB36_013296 [Hypothenemus hampei]|uniref:Uncharacterized protein n=1 Tax=Hypothenemus hampei TaxID=57062 RepID=A0ABD1E7R2_HYPHA
MAQNERKANIEEVELELYGFCSNQIYTDYRVLIDNNIKYLMVQMAQYYEEVKINDGINEKLFLDYKKFWEISEPQLENFHAEIRDILSPENNLSSKNCLSKSYFNTITEINEITTEIEELMDQYFEQKSYNMHLKEIEEIYQKSHDLVKKLTANFQELHIRLRRKKQKLKDLEKTRDQLLEDLQIGNTEDFIGLEEHNLENPFKSDIIKNH